MQVRLRVHLLDLVSVSLLQSHRLHWVAMFGETVLCFSYQIRKQVLLLLALRPHVGRSNDR